MSVNGLPFESTPSPRRVGARVYTSSPPLCRREEEGSRREREREPLSRHRKLPSRSALCRVIWRVSVRCLEVALFHTVCVRVRRSGSSRAPVFSTSGYVTVGGCPPHNSFIGDVAEVMIFGVPLSDVDARHVTATARDGCDFCCCEFYTFGFVERRVVRH